MAAREDARPPALTSTDAMGDGKNANMRPSFVSNETGTFTLAPSRLNEKRFPFESS